MLCKLGLSIFFISIWTDGLGSVTFGIILYYNGELDESGYHDSDVDHKEFEVDRISLVSIDVWV